MKGKWVVNIIGDETGCEISVLREDNTHGKESYGWDDKDQKIIIYTMEDEEICELCEEYYDIHCFDEEKDEYIHPLPEYMDLVDKIPAVKKEVERNKRIMDRMKRAAQATAVELNLEDLEKRGEI